jgi:hypothetical protein
MDYIARLYSLADAYHTDSTDRMDEILNWLPLVNEGLHFVHIEKLGDSGKIAILGTEDEIISWLEGYHRKNQWGSDYVIPGVSDKIAAAVDPKHYKDYANGKQWLETMSQIPTLREPSKFKAAVELQVRKYLDRNGSKDAELQELKKALWYLKALVSYIENGNVLDISKMS